MPYKDGKCWRGVVKMGGQRVAQRTGFTTKKAASTWERSEKKRLEKLGTHTGFLTVCNKYLAYAEAHVSDKEFADKTRTVKRLFAHLQNELGFDLDTLAIEEVTALILSDYLLEQGRVHSNNVSNKQRKHLRTLFNWALDMELSDHHPMLRIKKLKHKPGEQYTPQTKDILLIIAVATRIEKIFLDCFLKTGARRSEVFRLAWHEDINFEQKRIRLGSCKSADGTMTYRWLDMNDELYKGLMWLWKNRPFPNESHVWIDDHQGPNYGNPYKVRRRFMASLCERASTDEYTIEPFGFQALRRYVATVLRDTHKVDLKKVQLILGHSTERTTEVHYIDNRRIKLKDEINLL